MNAILKNTDTAVNVLIYLHWVPSPVFCECKGKFWSNNLSIDMYSLKVQMLFADKQMYTLCLRMWSLRDEK